MTKISVGESFTVELITGSEKVWIGGGEVSRFSVEIFLSHSAEDFRRGLLYCCINFWGRGGGYQNFTSKNFCLTVPTKISAGESFIVAINSGIEKSLEERGGGRYQDFPSTIFCLKVPTKISVGECFIVALISVTEKVWRRGGSIKNFRQNFFVSQCRKFP